MAAAAMNRQKQSFVTEGSDLAVALPKLISRVRNESQPAQSKQDQGN